MNQVTDRGAHTVVPPSLEAVPDPPTLMNPSVDIPSAYQSSVGAGSNDSVSGMVASSSDPNLCQEDWKSSVKIEMIKNHKRLEIIKDWKS